jgi:membrane protein required for colicin V production
MKSINWLALNWIDYSIIGILLLSLLIGAIRGFLSEVISLATWIAAFVLAIKYAGLLAPHIHLTQSAGVNYVIAFASIFIVTLIIGITINVIIRHMWSRNGLPPLDSIMGLLLGIVRGIFIVAFILLLLSNSPLKNEEVVKHSQFIPVFNPIVKWLKQLLPEKVWNIQEWNKKKENTPATPANPQ